MTGQWCVDAVLFSLPLLLIAGAFGIRVWPADATAAALFVPSLVLAVAVGLALEFIFGALSLVLDQPIWLVESVRRALATTLSGALVPLSLLPWGLGDVLSWLPFASMAWAPLAIYTGADAAGPLLLKQLVWTLLLWPLALGLWRWNREKVSSHGG
jgi:ABC-2 type transport system permease protein